MNRSYELVKHLGVLETNERGAKEVNLISWGGGKAKIDIRCWNKDHTSYSKGISLHGDEAVKLADIIKEYFGGAK